MDDFYEKPQASFTVNPQEVCQGNDNVFSDASTDPATNITNWNWNFDDGSTSTQQNPTKRFVNPGVYDVTLVVTNSVGCVSDPYILPVTVHLQPVIDAGQSYVLPLGTIVQLSATANSPGLTFNWSPPTGLDDATLLNPTLTALSDETYTLTATSSNNCSATDFITVKILKPVKVPNVFSPNGDGIHDKWMITNLEDYPGCSVEVFNRYGQKVFHSAGYSQPWDGRYGGKEVPVGVYYYVIKLENGFKPVTGAVTVLR
jgi:gliding motility-associated-like protein